MKKTRNNQDVPTSRVIEEIKRLYPDQSLAIRVTKTDSNGVPLEGVLLYRAKNRQALFKKIASNSECLYILHTKKCSLETELLTHAQGKI